MLCVRILYSHRTRSADGQYVHIEALTRAFGEHGHTLCMVGPEGVGTPEDLRRPLETSSAPQRKASSGPLKEGAEMAYSVLGQWRLAKAAKSFRPDILYERYNLFYHAGERVARQAGLPFILEVNAPLAEERAAQGGLALTSLAAKSQRRLWQAADAVLPVSSVLADMIEEQGVERSKIHVIPNGVDDRFLGLADGTAVRERYGLGKAPVLGFVGFVRDWHGVDRVVDWMASPTGQACQLLIVGDGPAIPALREQAAALGVADRFAVTGVVGREEVASYIAAFDIALQPAVTSYASPLKLQEYMAQARAIIAPDQPNIREAVVDGETALLVDPKDPRALFNAIEALLAQRTERDRLGQAARASLLDRDLTWGGNARRVTTLAESLLEQRRE